MFQCIFTCLSHQFGNDVCFTAHVEKILKDSKVKINTLQLKMRQKLQPYFMENDFQDEYLLTKANISEKNFFILEEVISEMIYFTKRKELIFFLMFEGRKCLLHKFKGEDGKFYLDIINLEELKDVSKIYPKETKIFIKDFPGFKKEHTSKLGAIKESKIFYEATC